MDDIYNDLQNYDEVDAVNRLKAENSELKHKLEDCHRSMQTLQQEFDNLEAEFKKLQTNYSSLLKISRAEIQRKTEMITNLNIEKDLLVIKALQNGPAHKVQQLIRDVREETEVKRKKKRRNKVGGQKEREDEIRRKSSRPSSPATSSTTSDHSNKTTGKERVTDNNKCSKTVTQGNESQNDEMCPDKRPSSTVADKRVSPLSRITVTPQNEPQNNEVFHENRTSAPIVDKRVSVLSRTTVTQGNEAQNDEVCPDGRTSSPGADKRVFALSRKTVTQENESQNDKACPDKRPSSTVADKRVSALSRKTVTQENESQNDEVCPDKRPLPTVADKRVSALSRKTVTQENESQNHEVCPDNRTSSPVADKRASALSRKTVTKENEAHNDEVFPDKRPPSPGADKRVSALSRHQLAKLSSDEEFEDMYSALKPKTSRESDRNRKRGRDDSHDGKMLYNSSHSRPYPDVFRERLHRRAGRYSDNEKNINREKQHNESNRSMNRGKQYNNDRRQNVNDSHYQRVSPERHRRGAKELGDERYRNRRLESPPREKQRFGSPQREKHHFKKIRERRKSYHGRDREHQEPDALGYKYPETTIHGAYGEPQNKKPRIEPKPVQQEEKRLNEKQYDKDSRPDTSNPSSKSPDFSHTEESSNESVTVQSDIKSTATAIYYYEDPRRDNKSLWNLQEVQGPKALTSKPAEISEEHVDQMDIDKALSIASVESGELDSETTDTALDINYDHEYNIQNDHNVLPNPNVNERRVMENRPHKENSPDNNPPKDIRNKSSSLKNESKTTRHKLVKVVKAKNRRTDEPSGPTSKNSYKANTNSNKHHDNTQMPSILQKLIHSMHEEIPDRDDTVKVSNSREENEIKKIVESRISSKTDKASSKSKADYKPEMKNTDKSEKETEKNSAKEPERIAEMKISNKTENIVLKTRDKLENKIISELITTDKLGKETENNKEKEPKGIADSKMPDKNERASLKIRDNIEPKNVFELKDTDNPNPEKVTKKNTEKEPKRIEESRISAKNEKECLPSREVEHNHLSDLTTKDKPEEETENNVTIFREFEHRVYSRHIVEGDLELSDESNDEAQFKIEEKKKANSKRKPHREKSKEKRVDSDTTIKTRSQKDKEKDRTSINKFSELFGDSSSLITPEDLNLATRTAHGLPADCCPPAADDAQDSIIGTDTALATHTTTVYRQSDFRDSLDQPTITEDKYNSKESRTRTKHKQNKDSENEIVPNDKHKDSSEQVISEVRKEVVTSTESYSGSEENLVFLDNRIKKLQNVKISNNTQKNYAKLNETPNDSLKSNKRPKTKGEKKLSHSEHIDTSKMHNTPEPTSNNTLTMNDNKENTSRNGDSEGNISDEMSRIFENTIVPSKTSSLNVSEINKEMPQLNDSTDETICSSVTKDVLNLAPVAEDPGLVKMVVISTGVQPPNSNVQYATPFNALASSTPAKDLSAINISSEMEPKVSHSAQVSVTIARDDSMSQPEADEPDMRITCHRRRRKVLKR